MILVVPVYGRKDLTAQMVESLAETAAGSDLALWLVDNGSPEPYRHDEYAPPFPFVVLANAANEGNFCPLAQVAAMTKDPIIALAHNDVVYEEPGWVGRVERAFRADPTLGMLGFAGSREVGNDGKRGERVESNLRGTRGHASAEQIGTRVTGLVPAAVVDGLCMIFRREALAALTLDASLPPAHWYDHIWSAQVWLAGWRVGTLGVECDHVGWGTEKGQAEALRPEWRRWCLERGLDGDDPMETIRAYGRERWEAYRPAFWPCYVGDDWRLTQPRRFTYPVR